jgi:hypothetical protein
VGAKFCLGAGGVDCWLTLWGLFFFCFVYSCRNVSRGSLVLFHCICKIVRRDRLVLFLCVHKNVSRDLLVLFLCVCKNVSRDRLVLFLCICKNVYSCWWVLCAYKEKKRVKILCPVSLYLWPNKKSDWFFMLKCEGVSFVGI